MRHSLSKEFGYKDKLVSNEFTILDEYNKIGFIGYYHENEKLVTSVGVHGPKIDVGEIDEISLGAYSKINIVRSFGDEGTELYPKGPITLYLVESDPGEGRKIKKVLIDNPFVDIRGAPLNLED
jgi:hypothetical protein